MAFSRSFTLQLLWRLLLVFVTAAAALQFTFHSRHYAATALAILASAAALVALVHFVSRSNRDITRFVDAIASGDMAQSFSARHADSGFAELAGSLQQAMDRQRETGQRARQQSLLLSAILEEAPIALLQHQDHQLVPLNRAARSLFRAAPVSRLEDYAAFGDSFVADLRSLLAGGRKLSQLNREGVVTRVMLTAAEVHAATAPSMLFSVQPIQSQLDAAEMALSRDLVRILSHEIMNSLTPVTSLAKTASMLMASVNSSGDAQLADARAAVDTVARRSESLMQFVRSYRALTVSPSVHRQTLCVAALAQEMQRLFIAEWPPQTVRFSLSVSPDAATVMADPDLVGQLLINLLRNAAQAALGHADVPEVKLSIAADAAGNMIFDITDNGPGIAADKLGDIFLPFFTTKPQGTGVGLSLSRQIAVAHDGSLNVIDSRPGSCSFRLSLPGS